MSTPNIEQGQEPYNSVALLALINKENQGSNPPPLFVVTIEIYPMCITNKDNEHSKILSNAKRLIAQ